MRILVKKKKTFSFLKTYNKPIEVLKDHRLAALGDAYINFVYSLALSEKKGQPFGAKVKGTVLAEAFKRAGLRRHMPSRITSHILADAAEALLVYAWLQKYITLEECVTVLCEAEDAVGGFAQLLSMAKGKIMF